MVLAVVQTNADFVEQLLAPCPEVLQHVAVIVVEAYRAARVTFAKTLLECKRFAQAFRCADLVLREPMQASQNAPHSWWNAHPFEDPVGRLRGHRGVGLFNI
jgi:hypothetical protein